MAGIASRRPNTIKDAKLTHEESSDELSGVSESNSEQPDINEVFDAELQARECDYLVDVRRVKHAPDVRARAFDGNVVLHVVYPECRYFYHDSSVSVVYYFRQSRISYVCNSEKNACDHKMMVTIRT